MFVTWKSTGNLTGNIAKFYYFSGPRLSFEKYTLSIFLQSMVLKKPLCSLLLLIKAASVLPRVLQRIRNVLN